jgi:hypothetical protein
MKLAPSTVCFGVSAVRCSGADPASFWAAFDGPQHERRRPREALEAVVAARAGEQGDERREQTDTVDRALEITDHAGRDERGHEIELQPWMAKAQRALPRRGEPLLPLHADHRAGAPAGTAERRAARC